MSELYTPDEFIANWAKILKCEANPYTIAVHLINKNKNYDTAMSLIFGLSWIHHTQWLQRCSNYFKEVWPADGVATVEWLAEFVKHYLEDKEKYPDGA